MLVKPHRNYIHSANWDILVVLDACRFDFFQVLNPFQGNLFSLLIESSSTLEWYKQYFPERYPYIHVSGNPTCNSKIRVDGFLGLEHFKEVIDVWKFGWDEHLKTVPPKEVTTAALPYLDRERVILHYMQPHFPAIGEHYVSVEAWKPNPLNLGIQGVTQNYSNVSNDILRVAYEENLRIVLKEVEKLQKEVPEKKIIITSDHGELLGEDGIYDHPIGLKHPLLNTVPWMCLK